MCSKHGLYFTFSVNAQTIEGADNQTAQAASAEAKDVALMDVKQTKELDEDEFVEFTIKNKKDFSKETPHNSQKRMLK